MADRTLRRGDSKHLDFGPFTDDSNNTITLTGLTLYYTAKKSLDDADNEAVFQKTPSLLTGTTCRVTLAPADMASLPSWSFLFADLQAQGGGYGVRTLQSDTIVVQGDVTTTSS